MFYSWPCPSEHKLQRERLVRLGQSPRLLLPVRRPPIQRPPGHRYEYVNKFLNALESQSYTRKLTC